MKKSASGQILVLVMLVVLIGMSIGLSIAARTLSNLKNTTSLNQSNRAFDAAEAGIENALSKLNTSSTACDNSGCNLAAGSLSGVDSTVKVTAATIGGNTNAFGLTNVSRDDVIQVNLEGYTGQQLNIYWDKATDQSDSNASAAIVANVVYDQSGVFNMAKKALDKWAVAHGDNFDASSVSNATSTDNITIQDGSQRNDYGYKTTLQLTGASGMVPSGTIHLVRIRLMYGDATEQIAIAPVGGAILPNQGQQITSTAVSGQNQRTVKVVRSNATLPAIFDYALFNGSTQTLTK